MAAVPPSTLPSSIVSISSRGRSAKHWAAHRGASQQEEKRRSRYLGNGHAPILFSNTLAPSIAATTLEALALLENDETLRARLLDNARDFRTGITQAGFTIKDGFHPIVPIMLGDAKLAKRAAEELLCAGIYVIAFSYPVVPKGEARIRVQLSAAHSPADVEFAVSAFQRVGRDLGVTQ